MQPDTDTLDDEIVKGRMEWLKAVWSGRTADADANRDIVDGLLEERYERTREATMTGDASEDFACLPRSGRQLWTLRTRYLLWDRLDRMLHRAYRDQHPAPRVHCLDYDDVWFQRFTHDQRFHDDAMRHMEPVKLTGPCRR